MQLYCRKCGALNEFVGRNWINDDDTCRGCGAKKHWTTVNPASAIVESTTPRKAYELTAGDKRLLHAMRINPEDEKGPA